MQNASKNAPAYSGSYDGQLYDIYNSIVNRDKFNYSVNDDALYQQYAQQYADMGRLAMQDTMGQAAALTGGYGSSYAQSVGQQQYDAYLQQLNDVVPELYQQAYGRYQDEGNQLMQQYAMLGDLRDQEYSRYQDEYNRWLTERANAQELENQAYNRGRAAWQDDFNIGLDMADTLAKSGDFSGYAALYGDDAANGMQRVWNIQNPDIAYQSGRISADEYRNMTGKYPAGYRTGSGGTNSGWLLDAAASSAQAKIGSILQGRNEIKDEEAAIDGGNTAQAIDHIISENRLTNVDRNALTAAYNAVVDASRESGVNYTQRQLNDATAAYYKAVKNGVI